MYDENLEEYLKKPEKKVVEFPYEKDTSKKTKVNPEKTIVNPEKTRVNTVKTSFRLKLNQKTKEVKVNGKKCEDCIKSNGNFFISVDCLKNVIKCVEDGNKVTVERM